MVLLISLYRFVQQQEELVELREENERLKKQVMRGKCSEPAAT